MVAGPENEPDLSSISNDVLHHTPSCPLENNNNEGRQYTNEGVVCVPYESSDPSTTNNKLQAFGNLEDTGTQTTFALSPYFQPPDIFIRFLHPSSIENYPRIEAVDSWFRIGDIRSRWRAGGNWRGRRRGGHPTTKTTAHRPE